MYALFRCHLAETGFLYERRAGKNKKLLMNDENNSNSMKIKIINNPHKDTISPKHAIIEHKSRPSIDLVLE